MPRWLACSRGWRGSAGWCIYDKPGTGVSDPIAHVATLEERVEDVRVVMDAAGIEHAAILGESEAGPVAAMFAATYPQRTDALIIYGSLATGQPDDDELAALWRPSGRNGEPRRASSGLARSLGRGPYRRVDRAEHLDPPRASRVRDDGALRGISGDGSWSDRLAAEHRCAPGSGRGLGSHDRAAPEG